jgi:hypothetical protein
LRLFSVFLDKFIDKSAPGNPVRYQIAIGPTTANGTGLIAKTYDDCASFQADLIQYFAYGEAALARLRAKAEPEWRDAGEFNLTEDTVRAFGWTD